ncbi:hypothetical protein NIES2111_61360 (plasmid) [Nostoc sp. NIES-2111]|nr:hypothetical protein NIES2111_61360 [Nostoc sp. NIES-2111]
MEFFRITSLFRVLNGIFLYNTDGTTPKETA